MSFASNPLCKASARMQARICRRIQSQLLWGAAMRRILNFVVASAAAALTQSVLCISVFCAIFIHPCKQTSMSGVKLLKLQASFSLAGFISVPSAHACVCFHFAVFGLQFLWRVCFLFCFRQIKLCLQRIVWNTFDLGGTKQEAAFKIDVTRISSPVSVAALCSVLFCLQKEWRIQQMEENLERKARICTQ